MRKCANVPGAAVAYRDAFEGILVTGNPVPKHMAVFQWVNAPSTMPTATRRHAGYARLMSFIGKAGLDTQCQDTRGPSSRSGRPRVPLAGGCVGARAGARPRVRAARALPARGGFPLLSKALRSWHTAAVAWGRCVSTRLCTALVSYPASTRLQCGCIHFNCHTA